MRRRLTFGAAWRGLGTASRGAMTRSPSPRRSRRRFFGRLRDSLGKSRRALTQELAAAAFDPADDEAWERLEEALIAGDVGVRATAELVRRLEARGELGDLGDGARRRRSRRCSASRRRSASASAPSVILVVGVNGTGKTTTIGKLAQKLREHDRSVVLAAADTFRAAAEEQLEIWAERAQADFVGSVRGADPAAVAFDAIEAAQARGPRRRPRRHGRAAAHADEPDGGAREGAPRDRGQARGRAARDAARRRRDDRPERPPAGAPLRRGGRRDAASR